MFVPLKTIMQSIEFSSHDIPRICIVSIYIISLAWVMCMVNNLIRKYLTEKLQLILFNALKLGFTIEPGQSDQYDPVQQNDLDYDEFRDCSNKKLI